VSALWLSLVFGAFIFLQSKYFGFTAFKKFTYLRRFSRRAAFEGEAVELVEELYNCKLAPNPWLRVESRISALSAPGKPGHQRRSVS
jgi:hypothetical protein